MDPSTAGPIPLSDLDLIAAVALVAVNALLSLWLGLGLGKKLLVASMRTIVQLIALGFVLEWVFDVARAPLVLGLCMAMIVIAAYAGVGRSARDYPGAKPASFAALLTGVGLTVLVATLGIVGSDPWWEPRYLIPLLGMALGNSLTGVSLGLDRFLSQLDEGRGRVEAMLALGATRWEAARPVAGEAIRAGMIPILNTMTVVGLVTIPGMMTGQILGGASPMDATRYQILIMFLLAAATALTTTITVLLATRALFDDAHRLRSDRIRSHE
jgi:putative ABC transport system permease protein